VFGLIKIAIAQAAYFAPMKGQVAPSAKSMHEKISLFKREGGLVCEQQQPAESKKNQRCTETFSNRRLRKSINLFFQRDKK
jgi:hypothetical protein